MLDKYLIITAAITKKGVAILIQRILIKYQDCKYVSERIIEIEMKLEGKQ